MFVCLGQGADFWCWLTRVVLDKIQEGRKMVVCVCMCLRQMCNFASESYLRKSIVIMALLYDNLKIFCKSCPWILVWL